MKKRLLVFKFSLLFVLVTLGLSSSMQLNDFIINSVKHNEQLVKNFSVSFSYQFHDSNGNIITPPDGGDSIIQKESFVFTREGNKFYCENTCQMSDGYSYEAISVFNGKHTVNHRIDLNGALISSVRDIPTSLTADRFTNLYAIKEKTMSGFLEASQIKNIRPYREGAHQCYLVEVVHCNSTDSTPLEQKIYFDASLGFSPVRVETYNLNVSKTNPVMVTEGMEYHEVTEGVYFPRHGRLINYLNAPDENGALPIENEIRVSIEDIKVNLELPKNYFDYEIPAGVHVYDSIADISYTVGEFKKSMEELDKTFNQLAGNQSETAAKSAAFPPDTADRDSSPKDSAADSEGQAQSREINSTGVTIVGSSNSFVFSWVIVLLLVLMMGLVSGIFYCHYAKYRKS